MTMTMTSAFAVEPACVFGAECSKEACEGIKGSLADKKCVNPLAGQTDNTQCGAIVNSGAAVNKAGGAPGDAAANGSTGTSK